MRLFRSEEHIDRWCEATGSARGAVVRLPQLLDLAKRWYGDRLDPDWRRATPADRQAILDEVGLTEPFWRLG